MEIGFKIHRIKSCFSTNDLAKELAEKKTVEQGEVVVCDEQTKGRGTQGRKWYSVPDKGFYFSVILFPLRSDLSLLPLTASLAIREAVFRNLNILIHLKWPNDLVYKGIKLGGILCESSFSGLKLNYSIIGIGINVKHKEDDFPDELKRNAVSLEMICKRNIDKGKFLSDLFVHLEKWYQIFLRNEDDKILNEYMDACTYHLGDSLKAVARGKPVSGLFQGLDKQGRIILDINGQEEQFLSGEIRITEKSGD